MIYTAKHNYLEQVFSRSCLESSPHPVAPHHGTFPPAMHSSNRLQFQLHQLKQKLLHITLEEATEIGLFKPICGAANQAAELAWTLHFRCWSFHVCSKNWFKLPANSFKRSKCGKLTSRPGLQQWVKILTRMVNISEGCCPCLWRLDGGSSTGSVYTVSGTIGQFAASDAAMAGGNFSLQGGFWAIYAVQTEGAPLLTISRTNNAVMVFWPATSTKWMLQQNANLSSTNWISVPETVMDNGTLKYIIVNPSAGNQFYRLSSPGQ
jgi:hypothetical protein